MRVVGHEFKILEAEVVDALDGGVELQGRERARLAGELKFRLLEMVGVEVRSPKVWTKVPGLRPQTCAAMRVRSA